MLQDLYINLAVETKRYMDIVAGGVGIADVRNALLAFWDTMPLNDAFKEVSKEDFFEVMNRLQREKRARKMPDLLGMKRFQVLGVPPSKTSKKKRADRGGDRDWDGDARDDDDDVSLPEISGI